MRKQDAGGLIMVICLAAFAVMYHLPIMLGFILALGVWWIYSGGRTDG